jgi:hypothetical protein
LATKKIIYDHGNGSVFCRGVGHRLLSSINAGVVAFTLLFQFWCPLHDSCIALIILIMTLINHCDWFGQDYGYEVLIPYDYRFN